MTDTYLEVTTETGRIYHIDREAGFWSRSRSRGNASVMGWTHRIWQLKAGNVLAWPTGEDDPAWENRMPVVGEHMYIAAKDEWYVSTPITSIEVKEYPPREEADAEVEV